jgi:hypothetical protein
MRSLLVLVLLGSVAHAETDLAVAVNPPLTWAVGNVGGSVHVGLDEHQAIRVNAATYQSGGGVAGLILSGGDAESDARVSGRVTDVGVSYMHFSNKLWDGYFIEAGLVGRATRKHEEDDFASSFIVDTDTKMLAARVLVGWHWIFYKRVFISASLGFAGGYEIGTETRQPSSADEMTFDKDVGRDVLAFEGFLRFGVAFGL